MHITVFQLWILRSQCVVPTGNRSMTTVVVPVDFQVCWKLVLTVEPDRAQPVLKSQPCELADWLSH